VKFEEVVIVDDSDADLLYTRLVVESAGIAERVVTFGTALELLAYLQRPEGHAVDVILLDINMPEMNGFEFLEAYQRLQRAHQAHAVVIMLSNSPDPADQARSSAFDCVKHFIVKPINRASAGQLVGVLGQASPTP
jgi:CheY-like chemotaxis protein